MVCLLFWLALGVNAQTRPWEAYLNEVMTQEDMASASWEQTYDLLCELEEHPMDINQVTREQLEELPFLSAQQIEGIVEYLWRYGRMESLSELAMVRELDYAQRRLLSFFVYVGEEKPVPLPTLKDIAKYGQNELMAGLRRLSGCWRTLLRPSEQMGLRLLFLLSPTAELPSPGIPRLGQLPRVDGDGTGDEQQFQLRQDGDAAEPGTVLLHPPGSFLPFGGFSLWRSCNHRYGSASQTDSLRFL